MILIEMLAQSNFDNQDACHIMSSSFLINKQWTTFLSTHC